MAIISQALTALGLPVRAAFLLVAAALWIVFAPIIHVCILTYATLVSLPLQISVWISQGDIPEGHVNHLAANHLLQSRAVSGPWGVLRSVSERVAGFGLIYVFAIYYGFLLTLVLLMPVTIVLKWALQPLWRGFRDWNAVRAILVERTRNVVLSVSELLVNLQYEYLQDEWREDSSSSPTPRQKLFMALDFVRGQVWLINLSSIVLNLARDLSRKGHGAIENFMRTLLESPRVPSLVKTPLSAFIVIAAIAEDGLTKKGVQMWDALLSKPATKFASEVHDTEQGSKRDQNKTIYEPLLPPKEMIRILRILPGVEGQPLQCFVHAEPRSSAKYEALSYVWGDPTLQRFITQNGTKYAVGKNLYECLMHLRRTTTERELWVDTLCINQADSDERSEQVLLMGDLYKKAERVVVWLGLDVKGVQELFCQAGEHHETDSNENKQLESSARASQPTKSSAVQHLLGSPWWSRVWTVQELILGSSVIVQCGSHALPWDSFCQVIDQNTSEMKPLELEKTFYAQYLALRGERQRYREQVTRRYPLLERAYTFRGKQASLAVDKIFGFYGLLEDPSAEIRPDYVLHLSIIEERFAIDFINRYKSLAVMAVAELTTLERENGRTLRWEWYPRWSRDGRTSSNTLFWTGLGDEVGGQPWSESEFDATNGRLVRSECRKVRSPYDYAIALEGWHTDDVTLVSSEMTSGDVDDGQWEAVVEQWLGMVCGWDGSTDGETRRSETLRLFYKTITAGLFDDKQLSASSQYGKYVAAVQKACRCRRLFFTSSGRCGLGPRDTGPGDEIWVLLGMAVPVLLGRRVSSRRYDSEDYRRKESEVKPDEPFRYLGQAYVDELMKPHNSAASVTGLSEGALETVNIWSKGW